VPRHLDSPPRDQHPRSLAVEHGPQQQQQQRVEHPVAHLTMPSQGSGSSGANGSTQQAPERPKPSKAELAAASGKLD
jgi:hypothetical protein